MNLGIQDKVAIVSGSSKGIGLEIALSLINEGCRVVFNSRNEKDLQAIEKKIEKKDKASFLCADVSHQSECDSLVNHAVSVFGRLDILVCNVGSGRSVAPGTENIEEIRKLFDINFSTAFNLIKSAESKLEKTGGSIVCISSICGKETLGAPLGYNLAKAALNNYVIGASRPLGKKGIRINAVMPGNIHFEGSVWEQKLKDDKAWVDNMLETQVALKRLGTPEEIASFVTFLVSPRASFATGSIFTVDGGQLRS